MKRVFCLLMALSSMPALAESYDLAPPVKPTDREFRQKVERLFTEAEDSIKAQDGIEITNGWAYATRGEHRTTSGYITITNHQRQDDALISASSPMAEAVELHTHIHENDVIAMRKMERFTIPAGGMIMLEPGGGHLMFINAKEPLDPDMVAPVELVFEKAGKIPVDLTVKALAVTTP